MGKDDVLNRVRNECLLREVQETIINKKIKEKIKGKLILSKETSAKLMLTYGEIEVEVLGETAQEALNQPMDCARIEKQMRKTGNTEFEFEKFEVELHGDLFMPMQALNELRRRGMEALEQQILKPYRREESQMHQLDVTDKVAETQNAQKFHVYVEELSQFQEVVASDCVKRIYIDANAIEHIWNAPDTKDIIALAHEREKEIYLAMPHIFRSKTRSIYENYYDTMFTQNWDGILIRNYESYEFLSEHKYEGKIVTDHNLYQFNQYAKRFWQQQEAVDSFTAPLELNYKELKDVGLEQSELVVYGYFPMMVSAQCVTKTTKGCKKQKGILSMKDRYQKEFAVKNHCDYCYNVIYNSAPVVLLDQQSEIRDLAPKALRLHFTIENRAEVKNVLRMYEDAFLNGRMGIEPDIEFTRGHFKRGIK